LPKGAESERSAGDGNYSLYVCSQANLLMTRK